MSYDRLPARPAVAAPAPLHYPAAANETRPRPDRDTTRRVHQRLALRRCPESLASSAGDLVFQLRTDEHGLLIQRDQWTGDQRSMHMNSAMLITTLDEFKRWLAAEPTRFSEPLLHRLLQRRGEELLDGNA